MLIKFNFQLSYCVSKLCFQFNIVSKLGTVIVGEYIVGGGDLKASMNV